MRGIDARFPSHHRWKIHEKHRATCNITYLSPAKLYAVGSYATMPQDWISAWAPYATPHIHQATKPPATTWFSKLPPYIKPRKRGLFIISWKNKGLDNGTAWDASWVDALSFRLFRNENGFMVSLVGIFYQHVSITRRKKVGNIPYCENTREICETCF